VCPRRGDPPKVAPQIEIYDACLMLNDRLGHATDRIHELSSWDGIPLPRNCCPSTATPLIAQEYAGRSAEPLSGPWISDRGLCRFSFLTLRVPLRRRNYQDLYRDVANAAGVPRTVWNMFARHGGVTEAHESRSRFGRHRQACSAQRPQHHQPALHRAVGGDLSSGCSGTGCAPTEAERKVKIGFRTESRTDFGQRSWSRLTN
jgi:hypothetical protein